MEVLAKDNKPIEVGDKVYDLRGGYTDPLTVLEVSDSSIEVSIPDGKGYTRFAPELLSHSKLDTIQEWVGDFNKLTNDMLELVEDLDDFEDEYFIRFSSEFMVLKGRLSKLIESSMWNVSR